MVVGPSSGAADRRVDDDGDAGKRGVGVGLHGRRSGSAAAWFRPRDVTACPGPSLRRRCAGCYAVRRCTQSTGLGPLSLAGVRTLQSAAGLPGDLCLNENIENGAPPAPLSHEKANFCCWRSSACVLKLPILAWDP